MPVTKTTIFTASIIANPSNQAVDLCSGLTIISNTIETTPATNKTHSMKSSKASIMKAKILGTLIFSFLFVPK